MGGVESKQLIEDFSTERELSKKYEITQWENVYDISKNYEYYLGQRMTVIPKHFYPNCVRGYFYGYYD